MTDSSDAVSETAVSAEVAGGRREANRRATVAAIKAAAERLIGEQGFADTTVKQISEAAGITERTFYRHFDGKEGLIVSEVTAWMERVRAQIEARPLGEGPVAAVRAALVEMAKRMDLASGAEVLWLFADEPAALKLMRRAGTRPLLRFESLITEALMARAARGGEELERFDAELVARAAVAIVRTVAGERRRRVGGDVSAPAGTLLERAFDRVGGLFS